jgi:hypothetical protein
VSLLSSDLDERNATQCPCGRPKEPGDHWCVSCEIREDSRLERLLDAMEVGGWD